MFKIFHFFVFIVVIFYHHGANSILINSKTSDGLSKVSLENTKELETKAETKPQEQRGDGHIVEPMPPLSKSGLIDAVYRWPNAQIIYQLNDQIPLHLKTSLMQAMAHISGRTCISFRERDPTTHPDYIHVSSGTKCMTEIGRRGSNQNLTLGSVNCNTTGEIIHQLVHVIGFGHESNRYDRDDYLDIQINNVDPANHHLFNKYDKTLSSPFSVPYDYNSIMHFGPKEHSNNGMDTVLPKQIKIKIGQRLGLSELDIRKINNMYCSSVIGFRIKSVANGYYLDISGGISGDGRPIVIDTLKETRNTQRWTADLADLMDEMKGARIRTWAQNGSSLYVLSENKDTWSISIQESNTTSKSQLWRIKEIPLNRNPSDTQQRFQLINMESSRCLRLPPVRCSGLSLIQFLVKKFISLGKCYKNIPLKSTKCDDKDSKQLWEFQFLLKQ